MDIFGLLSMIGGLALFLFGMNEMGDGLEKVSGGKLEKILEKLTSNPIKAVLLGAGVTAVIQSSSATTVMVVGLVNSGIIKLSQSVGIIMGANIGTTATSWILSLTGIQSENFFMKMLKPSSFSPIIAVVGILLLMFAKKEKKKDVGMICIGFAILMFGMEAMSDAVKPLANVPEFTNILVKFSNPLLGMLAGTLLTAVIQSSSASVGILQALCVTGSVTVGTAIPIIMGQNIGTCVTALISSIGAKKNAKRAAFVHFYFNILGTIIFMAVFYTANAFVHFSFLPHAANAAEIAVIHSVFNISATIILLPLHRVLEKLACLTVRADDDETAGEIIQTLDARFLDTPGFAIDKCKLAAVDMAKLAQKNLFEAIDLLDNFNPDKMQEIAERENLVDKYEDELGTYLVKLSSKSLSEKDSPNISMLLHSIGDFERISDHASNISEAAQEIYEKGLKFSEEAKSDLEIYKKAIKDIVEKSIMVYESEDTNMAKEIEPMEEVIDCLNLQVKDRHIKRLQEGKCTIELGFVISDLSVNFERISDHCSNIAVGLIQTKANGFDTHEYLLTMKSEANKFFQTQFNKYQLLYKL